MSLAKKRERVEEWRRCRLELTISQVERLIRLIAADEQRLADLEAGCPQEAESLLQPCAVPDPSLEPVLQTLAPAKAKRPKRNRRRGNPLSDLNAGSVAGAELASA